MSKVIFNHLSKLTFVTAIFIFTTCKQNSGSGSSWHYSKSFPMTNVYPIGITGDANNLYVSSGLKTEVHKLNYDGGLILPIKNIRKPKYLNMLSPGVFVVAESEGHVASRVEGQDYISTIPTNEFLDTPYGVAIDGNNLVITDYFKHRIFYNNGGKVMSFGQPGIGDGQFNGPSDVEIKNGLIYIVDSKNNRIQIFDTTGKYKRSIGEKDGIKLAGGLNITNDEIALTDYQGNRVLIYDLKGKLKQVLTEHFDQPSDVFIQKRDMYVVNYANNTISVFNKY
ncbi:MAG: NHL repeat-containing protein [Saprospiraceae bacterium]|jgi:DNA-binding beta-propeller fold protein YncE|nr:NHL repeat-containing protein [Saprospiraceae bacterium]MBK6391480.1 NHL repeat-containing protein [Saprospiraceae bacterium]MBK9928563.1 NHL repeat-containing protein [Saprospiraceae bacterium]